MKNTYTEYLLQLEQYHVRLLIPSLELECLAAETNRPSVVFVNVKITPTLNSVLCRTRTLCLLMTRLHQPSKSAERERRAC